MVLLTIWDIWYVFQEVLCVFQGIFRLFNIFRKEIQILDTARHKLGVGERVIKCVYFASPLKTLL